MGREEDRMREVCSIATRIGAGGAVKMP